MICRLTPRISRPVETGLAVRHCRFYRARSPNGHRPAGDVDHPLPTRRGPLRSKDTLGRSAGDPYARDGAPDSLDRNMRRRSTSVPWRSGWAWASGARRTWRISSRWQRSGCRRGNSRRHGRGMASSPAPGGAHRAGDRTATLRRYRHSRRVQHMVGLRRVGTIVAINKTPKHPSSSTRTLAWCRWEGAVPLLPANRKIRREVR